jgi:hypothetical protein
MSLLALSTELLSKVCRFLGLYYNSLAEELKYDNSSFQSLRLTCRALYDRTTYDAVVRCGLQLEDLRITLTNKSLYQLLHISETLALRDSIDRVWFHATAYEDEIQMFLNSSEALSILAQCFRNLQAAKRLQAIDAYDQRIHNIVFSALALAQFPRKIVDVTILPQNILEGKYRMLGRSTGHCAPYLKGLFVESPGMYIVGLRSKPIEEDALPKVGCHVASYRIRHPEIAAFLAAHHSIEHLQLLGCLNEPVWQDCRACNDLFADNIAPNRYACMTSLSISSMYVYGDQLQKFLKGHADTLKNNPPLGCYLGRGFVELYRT